MRFLLSTFIAWCFSFISIAQSNYQKAILITDNDQRLHGWINYKEWNSNPSEIFLKTDPANDSIRKYTIKEIRYFEIENMAYYERFPVTISMDKLNPPSELSYGPDHKVISDTVLLKIVQKGKSVDLYTYRDAIKTRYYIKAHGTEIPVELIYKKYMQEGGNSVIKTIATFKNQLMEAARKVDGINTSKLLELIQNTGYNEVDIARVTDMINGGKGQQFPLNKPSSTRFYAGIALSSGKATYSGTNVLATDASNKIAYFPKVSVGVDFLSNPFIGKFIIRFDLSFSGARYEMSKTADDGYKTTHTFTQYTESLSTLAIYNIYNSDAFKLNIGTGINLNLSQYKNSNRQIDDLQHPEWSRTEKVDLRSFWIALPVRAGTVFKKRYEVYGQYNYPISSISDYLNYAVHVKSWQVGFNYLF